MCTKTLQREIISYYFIMYAIGSLISGLIILLLVFGETSNIIPNTGTKREQILNCLGVVLACYSTSYNICCQITTWGCRSEHPIISTLSLIFSFFLMVVLGGFFVYFTINLWALLGFCSVGAVFGGLFLMTAYILRRDVVLDELSDQLIMKEGGSKASDIEQVGEEEDKM